MNIIHGLLMRIGLKIYLAQVLVKSSVSVICMGLHRIYKTLVKHSPQRSFRATPN